MKTKVKLNSAREGGCSEEVDVPKYRAEYHVILSWTERKASFISHRAVSLKVGALSRSR